MAEQVTVKLPNPMTMDELIASGKTVAEAEHFLAQRVFGADYTKDKHGVPIETGLGSPLNPTSQHKNALKLSEQRAANVASGGVGAEVLAAAVAAGVKAALEAHDKL